ncbi:hepatic sodium/bile acid cotransporter [Phyllobates terribilis]|uniref:hepatic sodium/bile acid cotransporter n=1 Tax=Phyllobates terribilis TaxID=111132 RepID=UPI003CCB3B65
MASNCAPISKRIMNETNETIWDFGGPSVNMTEPSQIITGYILDAASLLLLVVVMMSLGCTLKFSDLKKYIVKPKEVGIAMLAQYGIMPLSGFSVGHVLNLSPIESLAVLICSCCPGGNISNLFTLAVKGDINLSILMTTCSTILALGMMPLLLYIYCLGLNLGPLYKNVPFLQIVSCLTMTVIPCFLGALMSSKRPQYSQSFIKVGKILGTVLAVVVTVLFFFYLKSDILKIFLPVMIGASLLLPFLGYVLGYVMASIFQLHEQARRTICIETGCQNVQLCTAILKITFDAEVIGVYFLFPFLYIISQVLQGFLLILVFRLQDKIKAKVVSEKKIRYLFSSADTEELLQAVLNTMNIEQTQITEASSAGAFKRLERDIRQLLQDGAIAPVPCSERYKGHYSRLFSIKKPSGEYRTIYKSQTPEPVGIVQEVQDGVNKIGDTSDTQRRGDVYLGFEADILPNSHTPFKTEIPQILDDRLILRLDPSFLPKVVSDSNLNREIILPAFCDQPGNPGEQNFHSVDVRRSVLHYLDATKEWRKDSSLFVQFWGKNKGKTASKLTLARWIKATISHAYVSRGICCSRHDRFPLKLANCG